MNLYCIASKNRTSHLLTSIKSFVRHNTTANFFILKLDDFDSEEINFGLGVDNKIEFFEASFLGSKGDLAKIYLNNTPMQIACIFKPLFGMLLFQKYKMSSLIYFDTDLFFTSSIQDFKEILTTRNALFTPHLAIPRVKTTLDELYSESRIYATGVFNLGFFGLTNTAETMKFLSWWSNRLLLVCRRDLQNGFFDDQSWINSAFVLFGGLGSYNHPGYNVAPWNLTERNLHLKSDQFFVDNDRLVFFHFSSADLTQDLMLATFSLTQIHPGSPLERLYAIYRQEMMEHNYTKHNEQAFCKAFKL